MGFFSKLRNLGAKNRSAREWYDLGVSLAAQADLAGTHDALKKALAAGPETTELCIKIGLALDGLNDAETAAASFRRACVIDPRATQAHLQLGQLMLKHGRPDHALKPLREALRLADFAPDACLRYAAVLERVNEVEEAMTYYHLAAEASPSDVEVQRQLGRILLRAGHFAGSVRAWRKVLELTPNDLTAMTQLGIALSQHGQHEAAINLLTHVARARPDSAEAYSDLGLTLSRSGSHEAAIHSMKQAISLKARSPQLHLNLGVALMAAGRLEEAVAAYWQVVAHAPDWSVAHFNVGMALRELGDMEGAKNALQKAQSLAPDDPDVASALRELSHGPSERRRANTPMPGMAAEPRVADPQPSRKPASSGGASRASEVAQKITADLRAPADSGDLQPVSDAQERETTKRYSTPQQPHDDSPLAPPEDTRKLHVSEISRPLGVKASQDLSRPPEGARAAEPAVARPIQSESPRPSDGARKDLARTLTDEPPPPGFPPPLPPSGPVERASSTGSLPAQRAERLPQKSITGEIELFPIAEVLEFLKVHRSTGVLRVTSEYGQGELRMREGNLTGGASPATQDAISLLISLGVLPDAENNGKYRAEPPEKMGAAMVADGVISTESLRKVSMMQIESALTELVSWKKGDFTFRAERISEKESEISVDTRGALMDVLRKLDETKWAASKG